MSNYIEYKDRIAFHPGYYIKEMIDEFGLSQEDFALRLGTTPKNLSILIRGEQRMSLDIAAKLSSMLGTSTKMWLDMQNSYDEMLAVIMKDGMLANERNIFSMMDYTYYRDHCGLPDLPRQTDAQIEKVRQFLSVGSLTVLEQKDLMTRPHSRANGAERLSRANIVNSNAMLQIAINTVLKEASPRYDRRRFLRTAGITFEQPADPAGLAKVRETLLASGVVLTTLPHIPNAAVAAASKRVNGRVLLLVDERGGSEASFWPSLCEEVEHLIEGEFGITYRV